MVVGVAALPVDVEVHLAGGLPMLQLVGLPATAVKESRDRVRAALVNARFDFPVSRVTVNLAPADLPKDGGRFDLAIAVGILVAQGVIPQEAVEGYELVAELSLSGELRAVSGIIPTVIATATANRRLICAPQNASEAQRIRPDASLSAMTLAQVVAFLLGRDHLSDCHELEAPAPPRYPDFCDVKGQAFARRALEVAASGSHNLLMVGSPGTGKSMLASRLPSILPTMTASEIESVASIASLLGAPIDHAIAGIRPFRTPHHSASAASLVGGGSIPKPGEVTQAHCGVLFLDELPEFQRSVLEMLREPLETGEIWVTRVQSQVNYPAKFQLVAAMNPCPCGYHGDPEIHCRCDIGRLNRYQSKISGPLLDRIDIRIQVPRLKPSELKQAALGDSSAQIRQRVAAARRRQIQRQGCANAQLSAQQVDRMALLSAEAEKMLIYAAEKQHLSMRAFERIKRVSISIADLAGSDQVETAQMAEAIGYWIALNPS